MEKRRKNLYLEEESIDRLHDVQYQYRKGKKERLSFSEIVNRLLKSLSIEKIINIIKGRNNA